MMRKTRTFALFTVAAGLLAVGSLSGCALCPGMKSDKGASGDKSAQAGGANTIELWSAPSANPVGSHRLMVATVRDANGQPVSGAKVEWILARGPRAVGDIVAVDGGKKVDNTYAMSSTAGSASTLDMGTADKADDVKIEAGQTWCLLTAAGDGATNVVAYSPDVKDWSRQKASSEKSWMDVTYSWPADATNRVGTPHKFAIKCTKASDGTPCEGFDVTWKIKSGPAATLNPGGQMGTTKTDAEGNASVELTQNEPAVGTNEIEITIVRPARKNEAECECVPEQTVVSGVVRKNWVASDVTVQKTGPATAAVGEVFAYDIVVSNPTADIDVRDVIVTDELPASVEYVSSEPPATVSGSTLTWNIASIAPKASVNIKLMVRCVKVGDLTNTVSVGAEGGKVKRASNPASTLVTAAGLKLEKHGPESALTCDPIAYRLVVRNPGDAPARGIMLVDNLPQGITTAAGETKVEFPAFDLAPGETREFTIDARAAGAGDYTNTATVTCGSLKDEASATTKVKACVLTLVKKADRRDHKLGRPTTYTLTVGNTGDADATNTMLEDMVPAGMQFVSATDGGVLAGSTVTWNLGTVPAGGSKTVSLTLTSNGAGSFTGTSATARAYCCKEATAGGDEGSAVTYAGVAAILMEVVDAPDPIEVGGQTTYTIDVTNQGTADDTNIVIVATLAAEQKLVSVDTAGAKGVAHTVAGQAVKFAAIPLLSPGERVSYKIVVEATSVADVRFAVELNTDQLKTPVNETESTNQY